MQRAPVSSFEAAREYREQGHYGSATEAITDPLVRQVLDMAVRARATKPAVKSQPTRRDAKRCAANDTD